jgi:hypothetical protein
VGLAVGVLDVRQGDEHLAQPVSDVVAHGNCELVEVLDIARHDGDTVVVNPVDDLDLGLEAGGPGAGKIAPPGHRDLVLELAPGGTRHGRHDQGRGVLRAFVHQCRPGARKGGIADEMLGHEDMGKLDDRQREEKLDREDDGILNDRLSLLIAESHASGPSCVAVSERHGGRSLRLARVHATR